MLYYIFKYLHTQTKILSRVNQNKPLIKYTSYNLYQCSQHILCTKIAKIFSKLHHIVHR